MEKTAAELCTWNRDANQQVIFDFDDDKDDDAPFRIRMAEYSQYLQVDGNQIVHDIPNSTKERQYWKMVDDRVISVRGKAFCHSSGRNLITMANGGIQIFPDAAGSDRFTMSVFDVRGRMVHQKKSLHGNTPCFIATGDFARGVYVVGVRSEHRAARNYFVVR